MKIVHISDTHSHPLNSILEGITGDLLVHSGDALNRGKLSEMEIFIQDISQYRSNFDKIIYVPGNHDFAAEKYTVLVKDLCREAGIELLINQEITYNGYKIYGSPVTPWFHNWAFNVHRGEAIKRYWDAIPDDTNILITHGPPYDILDQNEEGGFVGCVDLANRILELKHLKAHLFGHIHEGNGAIFKNGIAYSNASIMDRRYNFKNKPNIITLCESTSGSGNNSENPSSTTEKVSPTAQNPNNITKTDT